MYEPQVEFAHVRERAGGSWAYVGQATFYDSTQDPYYEPTSRQPVWDDLANQATDEELEESRLDARSYDWLGREWRLVGTNDVDPSPPEVPVDPEFDTTRPVNWEDDAPSMNVPTSWDQADCDGGWPFFATHAIYDGESRDQPPYHGETHRATVLVHHSPTQGTCTGAVVYDANYVLTNAHCLYDDGDYITDPWDMRACSHGNEAAYSDEFRCFTASEVAENPNYTGNGSGDFSDDSAVLTLWGDIAETWEVFLISSLGPSQWDDYPNWNLSYPGYTLGDPTGCTPNLTPNAGWYQPTARSLYRQNRNDLSFGSARVKTKFDSAKGASGSPYFYCPQGGDCSVSAQIIGIQSHWNSATNRHAGPRAHRFRQFVLDNRP